jgi:anti-sigma regulatory factor (Ser/Thr protein kinase)
MPVGSVGSSQARHGVRHQLHDLDPDTLDKLVLVVSELVTNALNAQAEVVELGVWVHYGRVEVAVTDSASGTPVRTYTEPDAPGGRGLAIVEALADSWEVRSQPRGKAVVTTLGLPRPLPPRLAQRECRECARRG